MKNISSASEAISSTPTQPLCRYGASCSVGWPPWPVMSGLGLTRPLCRDARMVAPAVPLSDSPVARSKIGTAMLALMPSMYARFRRTNSLSL